LLALALLLLGGYACGQPPQMAAPPPPTVVVSQPVVRAITLYEEYTGNTRAYQGVEIRARVTGVLEEMHFQPARLVRRGDPLFVIEPYTYKAERDAAFAALKSAEAELARAESDLKRVSIAIQTNAVSESDLDLAQANRDMAEAALLSAQANLDRAELQYSYTQIASPLTGQVGRNLVDVGNVVSGSERTLLTTVNQIKPIHVYWNAPEREVLDALERVANEGRRPADGTSEAFVATLNDRGFPHEGRIDFIGNTVDPETGTIEVRAVLPNDDVVLFPGLFVRVRVPAGDVRDAVLVHETAIGTDLGGRYVYVVGDDNIVERRYLDLGPVQEDGMIYVREGLGGDETYIVEGLLRARPGLPVNPEARTEGS
jgi:RND family efflux transporter MFP subunit